MHFDTIVDAIVIIFFLALSCGFGWWMRNSEIETLHGELENIDSLCHRLLLRLQERDPEFRRYIESERELQYIESQRQLAPPSRNVLPAPIEQKRPTYYSPLLTRAHSVLVLLWDRSVAFSLSLGIGRWR